MLPRVIRRFAATLLLLLAAGTLPAAPVADRLASVVPRARIAGAVDDKTRVTLPGNRRPETIEANDIGSADGAVHFEHMILSLKSEDTQIKALDSFLASAHDPSSPDYGHWLTPQSFGAHFGVAAADLARITQWLADQGFTIDEIPPGQQTVIFSGTVAQVRAAFRTDIRRYQVHGRQHLANASDPQIPAALAPVIAGVVSLNDFRRRPLHVRSDFTPDYTSGSTHYLAAADFHTIYNLKPLYAAGIDGSGKSIAILGRSNVVLADIQQFRSTMNLPANPPQIIVNGSDPGLVSGDEGESDLDLEWAGAVAPAANIKFITSASTGSSDGIDLSAQYAVNDDVADVISLSYGACEADMGTAGLNYYNNLWQQASALGITVVVSSGDSGAAGCDSASASTATGGRAVNGLCSSPYATCVGGTQFADTANPSLYWASSNNGDQSSALSYIPEVVWNESGTALWASGGGKSSRYSKPSWQTTPGVPADGKRDVPDLSLTAAVHDGYLVYSSDNATQTQTRYVFGGTSASAPSFAGIMALVNQKTGYRQGSANATLYGLALRQAANSTPAYFHQITSGNNSVPGQAGFAASTSTPYYNQATGLGSVDGYVLVSHWTDLLPTSSTTLTATPNPSSSGQSLTLSATVTGTSPTGTVQFADGAAKLGSPVALSGGVATLATSALATGSHSLTATYSGDSGNQPSTSSPWTQTVLTATTVTLSASTATIPAGQTVTVTATVSGSAPTGTVQFKDGGTNLGSAIALSGATATLNTNLLITAGSHSITAVYSGDGTNAASTSPTVIESVTRATSTVATTASATSLAVGQSVTFTATVAGAAPTGSVQFTDGGANFGSAVALSGGTATLTTTSLSVGSHSITATYSGDANNLAASSPAIAITVNAAANGDVPALPAWAAGLFGALLLGAIVRTRRQYP